MKHGRYSWPYFFLRVGLGIVFTWIAFDIVRNPSAWIGFVPQQLPFGLSREGALQLNAVLDAAIGILFLTNTFMRLAALLAAAHLVGVLATQGITQVLIRDVGLLGASLSLLTWPGKRHRKKWWQRLLRRRTAASETGE